MKNLICILSLLISTNLFADSTSIDLQEDLIIKPNVQFTSNVLTIPEFEYLDQKKDVQITMLLATIFPGGGYLYNGHILGCLMVLEPVLWGYAIHTKRYWLIPISKLVFSIHSMYETKKYNDRLRKKLNVNLYKQLSN